MGILFRRAPPDPGSPALELPGSPELERIFCSLRNGILVQDAFFDRIYPEWAAALSRIHWTPLPVVRRAVELLCTGRPGIRILDVGSGAGKFCLAGAALSDARFFGIEQRSHLVALSRKLAERYGIPRVAFALGDLEDIEWSLFEGVYLFNPFQEHLTPEQRIDGTIELATRRHHAHVFSAERRMRALRPGARLVTYHGFGGRIPRSFTLVTREPCHRGPLECWEKVLEG